MTEQVKINKPALPTPLVLAWKELYSLFISQAFFGITVFFLLFTSIYTFYIQNYLLQDSASLRVYFSTFPLAFCFVLPALTMKSWAEERKMGSYEWLITMPFSEWGLVLGKFLACLGALCIMVLLTLGVTFSMQLLGDFDAGVILSEYIGVLLLGAAGIALGLFMSSLSKNQAAAFLISAAILLAMSFINMLPQAIAVPNSVALVINFFSLNYHFESFSKGLLDTRDIIFFIVMGFAFLFLNVQTLLYRKWK
jgi:ABC-2 type transport system permease protein